jgi:hypothetical protein
MRAKASEMACGLRPQRPAICSQDATRFPAFDRDAMIRSGLTFRDVFAQHALIAFDPPLAVRTILKPFSDADLGVNLAIHHRDVGLIAVGNDFFQANLTVA